MCWCRTLRGAAERLGLGYNAASAINPQIIVCNISGYGRGGPDQDRKAYDLLVQAEAGFLSITGTPEVPSKAGISVADIAAGMYAYTNILAALIQRGKTGTGCNIDVSMLESLAEWMGYPLYYAYDGGAATGAHRRVPCHHLSLWAVFGGRRKGGDNGSAKRT